MIIIEKILLFLNLLTMPVPTAWCWFHILFLALSAMAVGCFITARRKSVTIAPNQVFAWYSFLTLLLELVKQLMWSVQETDGVITWAYSWYSAPFQFCTMPLYICLVLCFLKRAKLREYFYSFLAFYSVISMTLVMLFPGDVFTKFVIINIHTMVLHGGGFVVAMFVIINRLTEFTVKNVLKGAVVFLCLASVALALNVIVECSGINQGAEFNMFYISPYYPCRLPVFCHIQELVPYPLFLLIYIFSVCFGGILVLGIIKGIGTMLQKINLQNL